MENTLSVSPVQNELLQYELNYNSYINDGNGLKNSEGLIPLEKEILIKTWNNRDKNDILSAVFLETINISGGLISSNKTIKFCSCFDDKGFSLAGIVESSSWIKDKNSFLKIGWDGIANVEYLSEINIEHESKKSNVQFIANDPAFDLPEKLEGVQLFAKNDNTVLIIPLLYFGNNKSVVTLLKNIVNFTTSQRNLKNETSSRLIPHFYELADCENYVVLDSEVEDAKDVLPAPYFNLFKTISLLGLNRKDEALLIYKNFKHEVESKPGTDSDIYLYRKFLYQIEAERFRFEGKFYDSALRYQSAKQEEISQKSNDQNELNYLEINAARNYEKFIEKFREVNYNERRVITCSHSDVCYKSKNLILLNFANLPAIQFPVSHPKEDETYVCHPFKHDLYLPIANYESLLLDDRINEYCYLLQSLGATSISITNTKDEKNKALLFKEQKIKGEAKIPQGSLDMGYETESKEKSNQTTVFTFERTQSFNPTKPPSIPANLVWYESETGWQRLAAQRLEGSILSHHEFFSTEQNEILSSKEHADISIDLKAVKNLFSANASKINTEIQGENSKSKTEWEVIVSFKPIEEFAEDFDHSQTTSFDDTDELVDVDVDLDSNGLEIQSENEARFVEEVKFMVEDDGIIDETEQKMLDRIKVRLNISDDRATQLKEIGSPAAVLSENEKEYLNEFKTFIMDCSDIGPRERRMLIRIAALLGIEEARALEIEKLIS